MKIQVHIEEKVLTILLPNYNEDGEYRHLTEPVFENEIIVDWLNTHKMKAVIELDEKCNNIDLQLGGRENEKKFLAFIVATNL